MRKHENYLSYEFEDFLADADFKAWVAGPTPESDAYWQGLVAAYPSLRQPVVQARLSGSGRSLESLRKYGPKY